MSAPNPAPSIPEAWGARFGWIAGGIVGLVVGFVATYLLEIWVLRAHSQDPGGAASHASAALVPVGFLVGALGGHAFGARGGVARYRALGIAAGVLIAAAGWALLVLTR